VMLGHMRGVVLHGGSGTRLRPLTHTGPKQLIPIANKPVSQYAVEDLIACGIKEIAFVLGDVHPEKVKELYGDGSVYGAKFTYIVQEEPKGIAHAVGLCRDFVEESPFIVYLGDNLIKGGIAKHAEEFQKVRTDATILLSKAKNLSRFGVAKFDSHNKLIGLEEKPKKPPSNLALTGIYMFQPVIFNMIEKLRPSWRNEFEITEAIHLLLENGYNVDYRVVEGWWKDTGTPEDILESNRLVLDDISRKIEGAVEDEDSVQGRVAVSKNARIAKGATVRGPSVIGEGTIVESGVYVGPYSSIGNHVVIKRGEVEDSIIMDNCIIDIPHRITGSIIGQGTSITSNDHKSPKALKLTLGENCQLNL
jgi:glucose-1-phosphate thymidylyltransferase